jgi:hypothetical protein
VTVVGRLVLDGLRDSRSAMKPWRAAGEVEADDEVDGRESDRTGGGGAREAQVSAVRKQDHRWKRMRW